MHNLDKSYEIPQESIKSFTDLPPIERPHSLHELIERAESLAGYSLGELAQICGLEMPENLKKHKGWVGNFIEYLLGAKAGSKAEQDFADLNVELKTIPLNRYGLPLETTFVSVAPLHGSIGVSWENCHVRQKLQQVLWVPIEGEREIPLAERRIGISFLWQPTFEEEHLLQRDWEELTEFISLGRFSEINAKLGEALQLRPKAANSKALTSAFDETGKLIRSLPLGFYLRKSFTAKLLTTHFRQSL